MSMKPAKPFTDKSDATSTGGGGCQISAAYTCDVTFADMSLSSEPTELSFPAIGGTTNLKLISSAGSKMAFKVKTSNNECYRVNPVYGFIDPSGSTSIEIIRMIGPPKDDKAVIQWSLVPMKESDPKAPFADHFEQGFVTVPLKSVVNGEEKVAVEAPKE